VDLALSVTLTPAAAAEAFAALFPGFSVVVTDLDGMAQAPAGGDLLVVLGATDDPDLPQGLALHPRLRAPDLLEPFLGGVARALSVALGGRVAVGAPASYGPHATILWEGGVAWLADDLGSALYDGGDQPLRVLRPLAEVKVPADLAACLGPPRG